MSPPTVSLRLVRLRANGVRYAFLGVLLLIAAAQLKALAAPPVQRRAAPVARTAGDVGGYAELFTRTFLDSRRRGEARDRALTGLGYAQDGLSMDRDGASGGRVGWTAAVATSARGASTTLVTVAAEMDTRIVYLAVPVAVDPLGRRSVPTAPALVGPPAVLASPVGRAEREVEDVRLRSAATRTVRHYLNGDREELVADLTGDAVVSAPDAVFRFVRAQAVTWTGPRRVAVTVVARGPGEPQRTFRYELDVAVAGGRWLVRRVHLDPRSKESSP